MTWFRVHSGMMDDPKILSLNDREFRIWMKLLDVASQHSAEAPGTIGSWDMRAWRALCQSASKTIKRALDTMSRLNMISYTIERFEDGREWLRVQISNWGERQYIKEGSLSTPAPSSQPHQVRERVAASRLRKKEQMDPVETFFNTHECNESVTTLCNEVVTSPEAEADTDKEAELAKLASYAHAQETPAAPAAGLSMARSEEMLSDAQRASLISAGWTGEEIDWGVEILAQREKRPNSPFAVLSKNLLPEVRNGRRPGGYQQSMLLSVDAPAAPQGKPAARRVDTAPPDWGRQPGFSGIGDVLNGVRARLMPMKEVAG